MRYKMHRVCSITMILIFMSLIFFSCAHLQSVSITQIPKERDNTIYAKSSKFIIFGFNFDNDYADRVMEELKDKCLNGQVTGILTKDEAIDYFLFIVMKRVITAKGFCIQQKS